MGSGGQGCRLEGSRSAPSPLSRRQLTGLNQIKPARPPVDRIYVSGSHMSCSYLDNHMKSERSLFAVAGRDQLPVPFSHPGPRRRPKLDRSLMFTARPNRSVGRAAREAAAAEAAGSRRRRGTEPSPPEKTTSGRHRIQSGIAHTDGPARAPQDRALRSRRQAGFPSEHPILPRMPGGAFTHSN